MIKYIIQKIVSIVKKLDDAKDPFEAGNLVETREEIESIKSINYQTTKKPRAKAIVSGKYGKVKGEKVADWRRRIIPKYNELKQVKYNPESKFYTTAKINDFIKEIEYIECSKPIYEKCGDIHH